MRMRSLLLPALALIAATARPAAAQRADSGAAPARRSIPAPRWRATLGASAPTTWADVAGGLTITTGVAPALGVAALWPVSPVTKVTLALRGATSALRLEQDGNTRSGDAVTLVDVGLGVERAVLGRLAARAAAGQLTLGAGLDAVVVRGPSGVAPFDAASAVNPGAHAGVAVRLGGRSPLSVAATVQAFRFGASTVGDQPTDPGAVTRLLLELRHGW